MIRQFFLCFSLIICFLPLASCGKGQDIVPADRQSYHVEAEYRLGQGELFLASETSSADSELSNKSGFFFYKDGISCLVTGYEKDERSLYLCSCDPDGSNRTSRKLSFDSKYDISSARVLPDGELYVLYCDNSMDGFDGQHMGRVDGNEVTELFNANDLTGHQFFYGNGSDRFWFSERYSAIVKEYDAEGNYLGADNKPYQVTSIFYDSTVNAPVFVENNGGTLVLDCDGKLTEATMSDVKPSPWGSLLDYSSDGSVYFCQTDRIFNESDPVFDFALNDYILSDIVDFKADDGGFEVLVLLEEYYYRVVIKEGASEQTKKEIVLATGFIKKTLQKAVATFNRTNDRYHVTIYQIDDWVDSVSSVYVSEIQKQLAKGEGPDIVTNDVVKDLEDFVKCGYVAPMEIPVDRNAFIDHIFEPLTCEGVLYGIPYEFTVKTVLSSVDRNRPFSPREFMDYVYDSDIEVIQCNMTPTYLLLEYFLYDTSNPDYIDWENGISHLDSGEFREALSFSKKYGDITDGSDDDMRKNEADYIRKGKAFGEAYDLYDTFFDLNRAHALFDGKYCYTGYPTSVGNGTVLEPGALYISSFSREKEGACEFIQYVISGEYQKTVAEAPSYRDGDLSIGSPVKHPVLKDCFEYELETKRLCGGRDILFYGDLTYRVDDVPLEEIERFKKAVYGASARKPLPEEAETIIWEETYPYFYDQCSLDEAVGKLHNRMQLYLDERGSRN